MKSANSSKHSGWFTGSTRLITMVSIVAVGLAGAAAVSANIGILDNASDSPFGNASTASELAPPATQVVDVSLPASALPASAVQLFAVDAAGTVAVATTEAGVRLDRVSPAAGWTWTLTQHDSSSLLLTLTNGARTLEFSATTAADGSVAANVSEAVVGSAAPDTTADSAPTSTLDDSGTYDDDHDDTYDDDHDDDTYNGHSDDDYEGSDDDD